MKRLTEENPIWLEEELWYTAEYPDAEKELKERTKDNDRN